MAIALGVVALITIVCLALLIAKKASSADEGTHAQGKAPPEKPRMKPLLTPREREMFNLLTKTFPGSAVLAQVSGGALLKASTKGVRNKFDRKQIDFALLRPDLTVLALIELDDSSHKGKEADDAARDEMFLQAGYSVLRVANIPSSEVSLRDMVAKLAKPGTLVRG